MSITLETLPAVDDIRQANALFLGFLRSRPALARRHFGLSLRVMDLLCRATPEQLDRAAEFPRALFRLSLPARSTTPVSDPLECADDTGRHVLQSALFLAAWNLTRTSGYAARMLLRLDDRDVDRFRHAELAEILQMSLMDDVLRAAFDDLDWIWKKLLTESSPERRQHLFLIGLQPELSLEPVALSS